MYSTFQNWEWTWTNPRTLKVLAKVNNIGSDVFQKNVSWVSFFREKVAPIFFLSYRNQEKAIIKTFCFDKILSTPLTFDDWKSGIWRDNLSEISAVSWIYQHASACPLFLFVLKKQKDIQRNSVCGKCIFFTKTFIASICP